MATSDNDPFVARLQAFAKACPGRFPKTSGGPEEKRLANDLSRLKKAHSPTALTKERLQLADKVLPAWREDRAGNRDWEAGQELVAFYLKNGNLPTAETAPGLAGYLQDLIITDRATPPGLLLYLQHFLPANAWSGNGEEGGGERPMVPASSCTDEERSRTTKDVEHEQPMRKGGDSKGDESIRSCGPASVHSLHPDHRHVGLGPGIMMLQDHLDGAGNEHACMETVEFGERPRHSPPFQLLPSLPPSCHLPPPPLLSSPPATAMAGTSSTSRAARMVHTKKKRKEPLAASAHGQLAYADTTTNAPHLCGALPFPSGATKRVHPHGRFELAEPLINEDELLLHEDMMTHDSSPISDLARSVRHVSMLEGAGSSRSRSDNRMGTGSQGNAIISSRTPTVEKRAPTADYQDLGLTTPVKKGKGRVGMDISTPALPPSTSYNAMDIIDDHDMSSWMDTSEMGSDEFGLGFDQDVAVPMEEGNWVACAAFTSRPPKSALVKAMGQHASTSLFVSPTPDSYKVTSPALTTHTSTAYGIGLYKSGIQIKPCVITANTSSILSMPGDGWSEGGQRLQFRGPGDKGFHGSILTSMAFVVTRETSIRNAFGLPPLSRMRNYRCMIATGGDSSFCSGSAMAIGMVSMVEELTGRKAKVATYTGVFKPSGRGEMIALDSSVVHHKARADSNGDYGRTMYLPSANINDLPEGHGLDAKGVASAMDILRDAFGVDLEVGACLPLDEDCSIGSILTVATRTIRSRPYVQTLPVIVETVVYPVQRGTGRYIHAFSCEDSDAEAMKAACEGSVHYFRSHWPREVDFKIHPAQLLLSYDVLTTLNDYDPGFGNWLFLRGAVFYSLLGALTGWKKKEKVLVLTIIDPNTGHLNAPKDFNLLDAELLLRVIEKSQADNIVVAADTKDHVLAALNNAKGKVQGVEVPKVVGHRSFWHAVPDIFEDQAIASLDFKNLTFDGPLSEPSLPPSFMHLRDKALREDETCVLVASAKAAESASAGLQSYCDGCYSGQEYTIMEEDKGRVRPYQQAIKRAVQAEGCTHFVEVGTGAKMVLAMKVVDASKDTKVVAIEGSAKAADEALKLIEKRTSTKKYNGLEDRITIVQGLSTDDSVVKLVQDAIESKLQGRPDAVVQELLGFFAGSEGAAYIMYHFHQEIVTDPVVIIPATAATLLCPVLLSDEDLPRRTKATLHAPGAFALMDDLSIDRVSQATGGKGPDWLKGGVMEYITFTDPENLCKLQHHEISFTSSRDAFVNALATWIWVEVDDEGAEPNTPRTGYPWGASPEEAPAAGEGSVALSTRKEDGEAYASSWPNAIIPFHETIRVQANVPMRVIVDVDPREVQPTYQITLRNGREGSVVHDCTITNLYPIYWKA